MKRSAAFAGFFTPRAKPTKVDASSKLEQMRCCICNTFTAYNSLIMSNHITHCLNSDKPRNTNSQQDSPATTNSEIPTSTSSSSPYAIVDGGIEGLYLISDFISEAEEESLIAALDADVNPWRHSSFNGHCDTKTFGVKTEFGYGADRYVRERGNDEVGCDLPLYTQFVIDRIATLPPLFLAHNKKLHSILQSFQINEFNANSYEKPRQHYLRAHVDDRQLSGVLLANLSLGSDVVMRYTHEKSKEVVDVILPRRTLQLLSLSARYDWTHEIPNSLMENGRRVSITMRQSGAKHGLPILAAKR